MIFEGKKRKRKKKLCFPFYSCEGQQEGHQQGDRQTCVRLQLMSPTSTEPGASHMASLSLIFLVCKMGVIMAAT
jgi:hypothetical protein